ncbi:alpha-ketoglutarate-dependent dioxygenase AlkB family protein [Mongoliitalea lutea]|uniref:Alkylated DNA repair protein n=1 Tax=Mongoliitalea lutea TaxID=849756 RepID=A0A8J3G466_9BACT|nr:alpha-ketoglutarate-dependent dioxygenase AlkB [Mongoliitalea lutea]GHB25290.1 alkylated DNA repair protein [Mongoliitalea lutea]
MQLFHASSQENLLPSQGEAYYYHEFFTGDQSAHFWEKLLNEIAWKQEPIWMFGKQVMQPRLTALYGDPTKPYGYSGIEMTPFAWTDFLIDIKAAVEKEAQEEFTHVLLNYYRNGADSMGWHRDNEKVLGVNPTIASVSFGSTRAFQLRHYENKQLKKSVELENGSLLLMKGECQHFWEHQIPKTKKVLGGRINLTFRKLLY